jgi:hypothetical protein
VNRRPFSRRKGPEWAWALELARGSHPIGVALLPAGGERLQVVTLDRDGVLVVVHTLPARFAVRWCINRALRVHWSFGELVDALKAGFVFGWIAELCPWPVGAYAAPVGVLQAASAFSVVDLLGEDEFDELVARNV